MEHGKDERSLGKKQGIIKAGQEHVGFIILLYLLCFLCEISIINSKELKGKMK